MFFFLVQVHNTQLYIMTKNWTWFLVLGYVINFLTFYPLTFYFDDETPSAYLYLQVFKRMDWYFWILIFLQCFVAVIPVVLKQSCYDLFWPRV